MNQDAAALDRGFFGHPKGLSTLFFTEMWERFSYYGMRAILILFMVTAADKGGFGFPTEKAAAIYGTYTASVYFMSIPGGWIADKLLGLRRAVLWGGILIAAGHYCLAFGNVPLFYAGLALIVLGTGLLKPNIASIVGRLYSAGDARRDAGFSIFYMGINLGAFIAPFVCGYLAQSPGFLALLSRFGVAGEFGWHWGFGAAGVGMTLGLVQYVLGARRLGDAGRERQLPEGAARLWGLVLTALLALVAAMYAFWNYRDFLILGLVGLLFVWLMRDAKPGLERKRIGAIIVLFVFATLFWAGFEQAGSSLTLFADRVTQNAVFGWAFPSSWWQSVQPGTIIVFAPVFAWLWLRLGKREPSSPAKFAYGLLLVGLGFLVVAIAAYISAGSAGARVGPGWLFTLYVLHTFGELSLSPVGMSTVTKLAPERHVGLMMGVWYLAISLGNFIGGRVAGLFEAYPLPQLFGAVFLTTALAALVLAFLVKPIRNLMGGVH